jgi:hypothetical protein
VSAAVTRIAKAPVRAPPPPRLRATPGEPGRGVAERPEETRAHLSGPRPFGRTPRPTSVCRRLPSVCVTTRASIAFSMLRVDAAAARNRSAAPPKSAAATLTAPYRHLPYPKARPPARPPSHTHARTHAPTRTRTPTPHSFRRSCRIISSWKVQRDFPR